jgi:hypothetical protein
MKAVPRLSFEIHPNGARWQSNSKTEVPNKKSSAYYTETVSNRQLSAKQICLQNTGYILPQKMVEYPDVFHEAKLCESPDKRIPESRDIRTGV